MSTSFQTARPRPARHKLKPRRLGRWGGRAALVAELDHLMNEPLTDTERVTRIAALIYPPDQS
ncbi:hypothetical protein [Kribbella sp. DT2]|uniref:hypothetical protein n=1 Tax=Kribbella sp. DT2 TaxID=3393427 RepID=UPI003CE940A0